ncbi:MAG: hypothetical protein VR64_21695 [Desulfatitalea sp. BRH_c12]|nr:MAG: hypothetical protein VR64_21695 [Desulfatitalea sp. BRH_c12]
MHKLEMIGKTDAGRIRANNEDIFRVNAEAGYCLVADGMGGAAAGEMASQIFAQTAAEILEASRIMNVHEMVDRLRSAFLQANTRILEHVQSYPDHKGMGCTAEMLAFTGTDFVIGHIGDSRTYRWRHGTFMQLTKDHSLVQDMTDQGLITAEQARSHSMRNVILRAVGVRPSPVLDTLQGPVFAGDIFLLCSDGLTDLVDDEEIVEIIQAKKNLASKADQLIEKANSAGGKDNITVALVEVT